MSDKASRGLPMPKLRSRAGAQDPEDQNFFKMKPSNVMRDET
jgi:hypothetical protein